MRKATFALIAALNAFGTIVSPVAAAEAEAAQPTEVIETVNGPLMFFDAADVEIPDFHWIARPVFVFADSTADPRFGEQLAYLRARPAELALRDVVVITDSDPAARSQPRQALRPRGFMMVLMGKDGEVELRKPFPWNVRELSRSIDKMPLRQQESRDANRPGG